MSGFICTAGGLACRPEGRVGCRLVTDRGRDGEPAAHRGSGGDPPEQGRRLPEGKLVLLGGRDGSGAPTGPKNGNYKHGRYTQDVAATRQWLGEASRMLRKLNNRLC